MAKKKDNNVSGASPVPTVETRQEHMLSPFLTMFPREIRDRIYELILIPDANIQFKDAAILRVNKHIHVEAMAVLLKHTPFIKVSLFTLTTLVAKLGDYAISPSFIVQETVEGPVTNFTKYSVHITIKKPGSCVILRSTPPPIKLMLIGNEAMYAFCVALATLNTSESGLYRFSPRQAVLEVLLQSQVGNGALGTLNEKLLLEQLSAHLWSFSNITIAGAIDRKLAAMIRSNIATERWPESDHFFHDMLWSLINVHRALVDDRVDQAHVLLHQARGYLLVARNESHYSFWLESPMREFQSRIIYLAYHRAIGEVGLVLLITKFAPDTAETTIWAYKKALESSQDAYSALGEKKSRLWERLAQAYVLAGEYDEALLAGVAVAGVIFTNPAEKQQALALMRELVNLYHIKHKLCQSQAEAVTLVIRQLPGVIAQALAAEQMRGHGMSNNVQ